MSSSIPSPLPRHIAVIMDGNGRWARERGLSRNKGHRAGADTVAMCVEQCGKLDIPWLTLYAFSSENWNRPRTEVEALMLLLHDFLKEKSADLIKKKIRLHAIGDLGRLPSRTQKLLRDTMERTAAFDHFNLVLALSYGSRMEIVKAARELAREAAEGRLDPDAISEEMFSDHLYTAGMPDPDLLIRTSGELRISNFLLWQNSYAEIHITDKYWPDFTKEDFMAALEDYSRRQRRFGAL